MPSKTWIALAVNLLFWNHGAAAFHPTRAAFGCGPRNGAAHAGRPLFMSSFAADGSEYSSKDTDYDEDEIAKPSSFQGKDFDDDQESEVTELIPVPMSKNSGNRFVALLWDQELDTRGRDTLELHHDRNELVEDHVMFCRKKNLYNETFNTDSMVDILRSLPM